MHNVFHLSFFVFLLMWWDPIGALDPIVAGDIQEYKLKRIVSHKKAKGRLVYQVRWRGYNAMENSWLRE